MPIRRFVSRRLKAKLNTLAGGVATDLPQVALENRDEIRQRVRRTGRGVSRARRAKPARKGGPTIDQR